MSAPDELRDLERLSALLADDLDPAEASALRARLDREPTLRAAFERLRDLGARRSCTPHAARPGRQDPGSGAGGPHAGTRSR